LHRKITCGPVAAGGSKTSVDRKSPKKSKTSTMGGGRKKEESTMKKAHARGGPNDALEGAVLDERLRGEGDGKAESKVDGVAPRQQPRAEL